MKLLIVEDESELAEDISEFLSGQNYLCELASNYQDAIEKINLYHYDCILLDIMLPGGDGIQILEEIKRLKKQDGVIIISAKNSIEDKVKGLEIGADDYLSKPFHHSELAARIHSVIRRKHFDNSNVIVQNELKIDTLSKTVTVHDLEISLTRKEFELLVFFTGNKNRVLSKEALAEHLSGDIADMFDNHDFVYAHIKNLKRKLKNAGCANYLTTVYGSGYKWKL